MLLRSLAIALQWRSQDFAKVTVERWTKLIEGVFYFQYIVADQGFPLKRRPVPRAPWIPHCSASLLKISFVFPHVVQSSNQCHSIWLSVFGATFAVAEVAVHFRQNAGGPTG